MTETLQNIGQALAVLSFVIGTTFLALHLYFPGVSEIVMYAMGFIAIIIPINIIIFLAILISIATKRENRLALAKTGALMLLNIPIAFFYVYVILSFMREPWLL
ncbi:hypothetical protein [Psychroserpens sp.]|uniref:hypothetical protein n=1 Tax=Psychroserpens sp. TaxID=2020870 RepID=UPI001B111618|nr:hypothetical protein [Psychroserpens sp.]MBO6606125.1 hypothetical protein [Psychroserpens sp.]MBO6630752.1 hypothetical protein [Psychroserpens sp.]MBO6652503.1 hypothetical protein [Psychroserpens sp.]MBO6681725.1 hypothetical protein [Psychroserpens sp.]MBO6749500.1 hypothetical protein [Psychroserpens sp.]